MAFCSYYNSINNEIVADDWYDLANIIIFKIFRDKFINSILFSS